MNTVAIEAEADLAVVRDVHLRDLQPTSGIPSERDRT